MQSVPVATARRTPSWSIPRQSARSTTLEPLMNMVNFRLEDLGVVVPLP